jgi:hypothetical protein
MLSLSSKSFWDGFYGAHPPASGTVNEWYFDMELDILSAMIDPKAHPYPVILHAGVGLTSLNPLIKAMFNGQAVLVESDFSMVALLQLNSGYTGITGELLGANSLYIPMRTESVDIIVEKGLFDSLSSRQYSAVEAAYQLLDEFSRVLNKDKGLVVIFSMFGPDSPEKDMLGFLSHPHFSVECRALLISPAEKPSQHHCFVYILRK